MTTADKNANSMLRQRAEGVVQQGAERREISLEQLSPGAMQQTIHELRVHQIELEMQNDELQRTRVELNLAQARYFDFYDLAPVGYVCIDDENQILQANLTSASLFGLARSKLVGQKISRFIVHQDRDTFYLLRQQLIPDGGPLSCEFRINRANDQVFWVRLDALLATNDQGEPTLRGVLTDVTQQRQTEHQLKESEQKLSLILENVDAYIYLKDTQGRYLFANRPVRELFAASTEQIVGRGDEEFFDTEASAQLREDDQLVLRDGKTSRTEEVDFRLNNGRTLTALSVKLPLRNAAGEVVALCGISTDITQLRALQAAQLALAVEVGKASSRQQLRELIALNEATREEERKHIAREVHDELGQVLTALRMNMSLLDMRYGTQDTGLQAAVQGMKTLVDRAILGVRNVATHLRPVALDMGLVPAIEWLCQEFARTSGLRCTVQAQDNLEFDALRAVVIFRIVQESLTNIARYAQASAASVTLACRGPDLWLEVRDDGCGFDDKAANNNKSFGLLGMRERAIALGGCLGIVSTPGQGTVVSLTIPFHLDATQRQT
jgi:PAS domain S-box-containing protein